MMKIEMNATIKSRDERSNENKDENRMEDLK